MVAHLKTLELSVLSRLSSLRWDSSPLFVNV